jgi:cytoskeletal protein RodZ
VASFGVRLRQEREKRAVTLDDISLATKISTRMLRALEEEHFDQLPGGIFNKGFIRAYARCVGLDEDQAISDYLAAVAPPANKSEKEDQPPILEPPPRVQKPTTGLPWSRLALVLLIVALGLAAWGYYSRELQNRIRNSGAPAAAPDVKPQTKPSSPPPPSASTATTAGAAKAAAPIAPANAPSSAPSKAAGETSPAPTANPPVSTPNQSPSPPRPARLLLLIKARNDYSWLSISVDGEIVTRSILIAPSEKSVRAEKEIIIKAGNVGALDFEFNGQKLPAQGGYGEVKTLTFDATGLRPRTPKPQEPAQLP